MATAPSAWAHLPNAAYIDRILADLTARPEVWNAARDAAWVAARGAAWVAVWSAAQDAARSAAQGAVWNAVQNAARGAARGAARSAAWNAAWDAVRDAVYALIVWDDVGYILDMTPDACRMLAHTAEGNHKHAAVLLLPAGIALTT